MLQKLKEASDTMAIQRFCYPSPKVFLTIENHIQFDFF